MKHIYLDYAAATPMDPAAVKAMQSYLSDKFYNPSAAYQPAREVRKDLEAARAKVADVLGAKDQEIVFTAGGTEANNLAIHGILSQFPDGHIVTIAIEHESVLEPAKKYKHTIVSVKKDGRVDPRVILDAITDETVLISVMYANNEVGTIEPIKDVAELVAKVRQQRKEGNNTKPLWLHTDAAQAANYLDLHTSRLKIDLMTLNGGKIYGAKQSGCLYIRKEVRLAAGLLGGGQENSMRSGTENIAAIQAFAIMLQKVQSDRKSEIVRLEQIRKKFIATLSHNKITYIINGSLKYRLPNNLNLTFPGVDGERLLMELDSAGLLVATGSACTASNAEPSHVLLALGLSYEDASASLRLTFGRPTTEKEAEKATKILISTLAHHRRLV